MGMQAYPVRWAKARSVMADPLWPSKIRNGLVNPILNLSNLGVKDKPINKSDNGCL